MLNKYGIMLCTLAFFRIHRVGANAECHECAQTGMHLMLTIEKKFIIDYLFPKIHTYISECCFQKSLYAYC